MEEKYGPLMEKCKSSFISPGIRLDDEHSTFLLQREKTLVI